MMITGSSLALQLLANVNSYYLVMILRQISSVGCGRMSKVFANYYYISNVYNINTQSSKWGNPLLSMAGVSLQSLGQRRESLGQRTLLLLWTFYLKWRSSIQGKKQANACC